MPFYNGLDKRQAQSYAILARLINGIHSGTGEQLELVRLRNDLSSVADRHDHSRMHNFRLQTQQTEYPRIAGTAL